VSKNDEGESKCTVLRQCFLQILEKLSLSEVPLEKRLSSYPTLVNRHLLKLFRDKNASVRQSVHTVWQQLLVQSLPKPTLKESLSAEEKSFVDTHVSFLYNFSLSLPPPTNSKGILHLKNNPFFIYLLISPSPSLEPNSTGCCSSV